MVGRTADSGAAELFSRVSKVVVASQGSLDTQKTRLLQNTVADLGDADGSELHS